MTLAIRCIVLLLALVAGPAPAAEFAVPVEGGRTLQLTVPDAWHGTSLQNGPSTTVVFVPAQGRGFRLLLTAVDTAETRAVAHTLDYIRATVADVAEQARAGAVESELPVQDLDGPQVIGAWFSATDRADPLPAGEFRYMTQGELSVDGMPAVFTLLVNADDAVAAAAIRDQALAALRTLRPAPMP